ncbi:hypothetical protein GCM10027422_43280 [Hymenobacter arcticus]
MTNLLYAPQGALLASNGLLRSPAGATSGPADSGPADSGPADSGPADSGPADSGPGYGYGYGGFTGVNAGALALPALVISRYGPTTRDVPIKALRGTALDPPTLSWLYNRAVQRQVLSYENPQLGAPYDGLAYPLPADARTYTPAGDLVGPHGRTITTDFSYRLTAYDADNNCATAVVQGFFGNYLLFCSSAAPSPVSLAQFTSTASVANDAAYWLAHQQALSATPVQPNEVTYGPSFNLPVRAGAYFYYAIPASLDGVYRLAIGTAYEWSTNHQVGSANYTNVTGFTERYTICRSAAPSATGGWVQLHQHVADPGNQPNPNDNT